MNEYNGTPARGESAGRLSGLELGRIALIVSVVAMAVVALCLLLWKVSNVILLLFGAVLFAVFLTSIASWIGSHTRLGERTSTALTLILSVGLLVVAGYLVAPSIAEQFDEMSRTIPDSVEQVRSQLESYKWGQWVLARMPDAEQIMTPSAAAQRAGRFFTSLFGGITSVLVVLVAGIFMAFTPGVYRKGFLLLVPTAKRSRAEEVLVALESTIIWWLLGRFLSMTVIGVMTWIGLMLLDVPLALTLGLIAGLLSFIPFIGPLLSAVPAVLIALTIDPSKAWHVVLLFVVIQLVEGNLITPLIERKTVWLPPALTILMQVLFGVLFGALGVILATPLTATTIVLVKMLYLHDLLGEDVEASRAT